MAPIARALSDRQIDDVSAYFASMAPRPRLRRHDEALPQRFAVTGSTAALAGCGTDVQSVMAPRGTQAGQIANLAWWLFGLGAVVLAIVMAALWLAIRGSPRVRAALAQDRAIVALGLIFPAVTLTLLLGYGVWLMRSAAQSRRRLAIRSASRSSANNGGGASLMRARRRSRARMKSPFRSEGRSNLS